MAKPKIVQRDVVIKLNFCVDIQDSVLNKIKCVQPFIVCSPTDRLRQVIDFVVKESKLEEYAPFGSVWCAWIEGEPVELDASKTVEDLNLDEYDRIRLWPILGGK